MDPSQSNRGESELPLDDEELAALEAAWDEGHPEHAEKSDSPSGE